MDLTRNSSQQDTGRFDREKAKDSQRRILSEFLPHRLSYAEAERITGTSRSNIKRACDGESLLNAESFAKVICANYKLNHYANVRLYLENDSDLDQYLANELGDEYLNNKSGDEKTTYNLISAIDCPTTRKLYGFLWAKNRANIEDLHLLLGEKESERAISKLEKYSVITVHRPLGVIELNQNMTSDRFAYFKSQVKLVSENLDEAKVEENLSCYSQDIVLISKKNENRLYDFLLQKRSEIVKFVSELEHDESVKERSELVEYSLVYNHLESINDANSKGVIQ